jgi:hypothetical protein
MTRPQFIVCRVGSQSGSSYSGSLELERGPNGDTIMRVHGSDSLRAVVRLDASQCEDLRAVLASIAEGNSDE